MSYYVFTLKFLTPVHFGSTEQGGGLEKAGYTCGSDTFFSALCQEAVALGGEKLQNLLAAFDGGGMRLSSLFPFYQENGGELELYLPKPFKQGAKLEGERLEYAEMKTRATETKALSKLSYVRASELRDFLRGELKPTRRDFALPNVATRVNCRGEQSLPYYVKSYSFINSDQCATGLYFVLEAADDDQVDEFKELLLSLGYTGIGGKRSSGYGKFELFDDEGLLDEEYSVWGEDDLALAQLLTATGTGYMSLSVVHPSANEVPIVKQGSYRLLKRSGFVGGVYSNVKRQSVYMLAEGSCLSAPLAGELVRLEVSGVAHPVYRLGRGLFVGL